VFFSFTKEKKNLPGITSFFKKQLSQSFKDIYTHNFNISELGIENSSYSMIIFLLNGVMTGGTSNIINILVSQFLFYLLVAKFAAVVVTSLEKTLDYFSLQ
jgi:hypothetical protein